MWAAYSPFEEMRKKSIESLDDLATIRLPAERPTQGTKPWWKFWA
jgi:hypothetical protein